ncbi:MAG: hypothetical protein CL678_08175 [Bdellovibrionaceae bacterium]|nr:hypothetical protein [Pseudobdellovibrionaceae bacterium]|tara:strand:- start:844 stop:1479 length:636 start_codon:yes stop_codon:yes gene_type:complete
MKILSFLTPFFLFSTLSLANNSELKVKKKAYIYEGSQFLSIDVKINTDMRFAIGDLYLENDTNYSSDAIGLIVLEDSHQKPLMLLRTTELNVGPKIQKRTSNWILGKTKWEEVNGRSVRSTRIVFSRMISSDLSSVSNIALYGGTIQNSIEFFEHIQKTCLTHQISDWSQFIDFDQKTSQCVSEELEKYTKLKDGSWFGKRYKLNRGQTQI